MPPVKRVREIMSTSLTVIDSTARLLDAVLVMRSSGYRHLPVVNGEKLVGMISDRDVHRAAPSIFSNMTPEEYNQIFESTPIEKVMARELVTAKPDTPLREVVLIMHERKVGSVPVVEGDTKLVGLITTSDLLGILIEMLGPA